MNLKQLRCTVCGATIDTKNIDFTKRTARCNACYETFVIEQAENFAKVEVDKTKDIQNYRENLVSAIDKDDAMGMIRYAGQILDILPEDFDASYFYAYAYVKRGDSRYLYDFYDYTDREYTEDSAMRVAEHIANHCDLRDEKRALSFLRSMKYEPDTYVSLFKDTFADRVKKEELYDDITRDVFICHRSTNADVAKRIVQELEADGNTCWISSRNLRPNDNENYWTNIKKAIKSCRIFLVVSSRDAMFSGDVKKEMAFAKELNKSRIEIKIDESEHNAFFKDFFDGCKWVKGENYEEIKTRVADLLAKVLSGQGDVVVRKVDKVKFTPIQEAKPIKKIVVDELHEHDYKKAEVVPPTCKEPGYTVYRCACGEIKKGDFTPKRGEHEFIAAERKEPTCTEDGYVKYECRYCDATKKDVIPAIGHYFQLSEEKPSTCIEEGYRIYTCQNCGEKKVEKLPLIPHTFGAWVKTKNPTCTEEGEETKQCTFCGYKESRPVAPNGHKFGKWTIKTEPTCTEEGTKIRQCLICGSTEEEKVGPTGHDFGEWQLSLSDPEKEERICKKCGAIETRLLREVEEELKRQKKEQEEEKIARKNKKISTVALGSFIVSLASLLCAIILWGVFYKRGYCTHPVAVVLTFFLSFALILVSLILTIKMKKSGYYHFIIDIPILMVCAIIIGILFFSSGIHSATSQKAYYQEGIFYVEVKDGYEVATGSGRDIYIPSDINGRKVYGIRSGAFKKRKGLKSIYIPESITDIGAGILSGCSSLEEITLPYLKERMKYYFDEDYNADKYDYSELIPSTIKSVTVEGGEILSYAFAGCENLTELTLGGKITKIGKDAFSGVYNLRMFNYTGNIESWCSITFADGTSNPIDAGLSNPARGNLYIKGELITDLVIPNTVKKINDYAFYRATCLKSITISNSVTSIGESAFRDCSNLLHVSLGSSVTTIGQYAFSNCLRLVEINNKSSLNIEQGSLSYGNIGYRAKNIYANEGMSKLLTSEDGYVFYIDGIQKSLICYLGNKSNITLPYGITEINQYAFYNARYLKNITIPNSVRFIGTRALNTGSLEDKITFNGTMAQWNSINKGEYWRYKALGRTYTVCCADGNCNE